MYKKYTKICTCFLVSSAALLLIGAIAKSAMLMAVGMLLGILAGVMLVFDKDVRRHDNKKNPITASMATVVGFRKESHSGRYSYSQQYYISFQLTDGQVMELELEVEDYERIKLGDTALLRYRTWEFLSFDDRDPSSPDVLTEAAEEYTPAADEISVEVDWAQAEKMFDWLNARAAALRQKIKEQFKSASHEDEKQPEEEESGILTHELDE